MYVNKAARLDAQNGFMLPVMAEKCVWNLLCEFHDFLVLCGIDSNQNEFPP